jgi:hypothetical protein
MFLLFTRKYEMEKIYALLPQCSVKVQNKEQHKKKKTKYTINLQAG